MHEPTLVEGHATPGLQTQIDPFDVSPALQLFPAHGASFRPPQTPLQLPEEQV